MLPVKRLNDRTRNSNQIDMKNSTKKLSRVILAAVLIVFFLAILSLTGCDQQPAKESKKKLFDPGPKIIFPRGAADPQLLSKKTLHPLPKTAPPWAKSAEKRAVRYYFKKGLNISQGYVGDQELIFILTKPTGGNIEAKSFALWKRKGQKFAEVWRLDQNSKARTAILITHQNVDGRWGDGVISNFQDKSLFEAFTYHNYPYPKDEKLSKSHGSIWADETTVFRRKGDGYKPVGYGVTYFKPGHYLSWPWDQNPNPKPTRGHRP